MCANPTTPSDHKACVESPVRTHGASVVDRPNRGWQIDNWRLFEGRTSGKSKKIFFVFFFCFYPVVFLWGRLFPLSRSKSVRIWSSGCVSKHLERSCYSFNRLPTGKKKYELEQAVDEERRRICRDAQNAYKPLVEVGNFFFHWVRLLVLRGCFLTAPPPLFMSKNKECQIAN